MPQKISRRSYVRYNRYGKSYRKRSRYRPYGNRKFTTRPFITASNLQSSITIPGKNVLPNSLRTQFKLTTRIELIFTASTSSTTAINFKANSLLDPTGNWASTKFQMYNELMTFYNRYNVLGSYIKLTVCNTSAIPIIYYCAPTTNTSDTYTINVAPQIPGAKYITVEPEGGRNTRVLTNYKRPSSVYGFAPGDNSLEATSTADPSALVWWHMSFAPVQSGYGEDIYVYVYAEVIYYTLLTNPIVVANST